MEPQIKRAWDWLKLPSCPRSPPPSTSSGASSSDCPASSGALGQGHHHASQRAPFTVSSLWMLSLVTVPYSNCFKGQSRRTVLDPRNIPSSQRELVTNKTTPSLREEMNF